MMQAALGFEGPAHRQIDGTAGDQRIWNLRQAETEEMFHVKHGDVSTAAF